MTKKKKPLWTPEEDQVLKSGYETVGAKGVVKRLKKLGFQRTQVAITARAKRLGVEFKHLGGRNQIPLVYAYPRHRKGCPWQAHPDIIRAAERDGVLTRSKVYPFAYMAPISWVDEFMDNIEEEWADSVEVATSWLKTNEVARIFGFTPRSFSVMIAPSASKEYKVREYVARIPQRLTSRNLLGLGYFGRFWKPEETYREAEKYQIQKVTRKMRRNGRKP